MTTDDSGPPVLLQQQLEPVVQPASASQSGGRVAADSIATTTAQLVSPASTVASSEAAETVPLTIPFYDGEDEDENCRGGRIVFLESADHEESAGGCSPGKGTGAPHQQQHPQGRTLFIVSLVLKVVILCVVGAFVAFCLVRRGLLSFYLQQFVGAIQSLGVAGPPSLAVSYGLLIAVFFPVEVLATVAGYIFTQRSQYGRLGGLAVAAVCMETAFCISCFLNFFATRSLFARFRCSLGGAWAEAIDNVILRRGWRVVALIRLTPIIPFAVSNCLLGFTRVPFVHVLATVPCTLPLLLFTIYLGSCLPRVDSDRSWEWDGFHIAAVVALTLLTLCTLTRIGFLTLKEFKRITYNSARLDDDEFNTHGNTRRRLSALGSRDPLIGESNGQGRRPRDEHRHSDLSL